MAYNRCHLHWCPFILLFFISFEGIKKFSSTFFKLIKKTFFVLFSLYILSWWIGKIFMRRANFDLFIILRNIRLWEFLVIFWLMYVVGLYLFLENHTKRWWNILSFFRLFNLIFLFVSFYNLRLISWLDNNSLWVDRILYWFFNYILFLFLIVIYCLSLKYLFFNLYFFSLIFFFYSFYLNLFFNDHLLFILSLFIVRIILSLFIRLILLFFFFILSINFLLIVFKWIQNKFNISFFNLRVIYLLKAYGRNTIDLWVLSLNE